jgi:hypothetical protein
MDPLTYEIMADPVMMPDGQTYDRQSIARALQAKPQSPITRQAMSMAQSLPNRFARDSITEFLAQLISIVVRWANGRDSHAFQVSVSLKDSIRDAKAKLVTLTKIPVDDQVLVYNNEALADDERFYNGRFKNKVSLELRRQQTQVFVKGLDGRTLVMAFYPSETLLDFKHRIHARAAIPAREQRLVFEGKPMGDDNALMKSFGITKDATLHLLMRLRGASK